DAARRAGIRRSMNARIGLALALVCVACTAIERVPDRPPAALAEIPIELRHGLPTMEVIVEGEPLRLFLDLGGYQPISLTVVEMQRAKVTVLPRVRNFAIPRERLSRPSSSLHVA